MENKEFYPTYMYHEKIAPEGKVINSQEEFDALDEGWKETPAEFGKKQDEKADEETKDKNGKAPQIKETDYTKLKVAELKELLISKGVAESELDGLKKDELIAKVGDL